MSDIEEKEDDYDRTSRGGNALVRGKNVHIPPTGEVDNRQSHQLQDANKNITKATSMMHDNMSSSHNIYSNTTTSSTTTSMLQNTKLSRNDYENIYYQKGKTQICTSNLFTCMNNICIDVILQDFRLTLMKNCFILIPKKRYAVIHFIKQMIYYKPKNNLFRFRVYLCNMFNVVLTLKIGYILTLISCK